MLLGLSFRGRKAKIVQKAKQGRTIFLFLTGFDGRVKSGLAPQESHSIGGNIA
jgi:hypothetical protein